MTPADPRPTELLGPSAMHVHRPVPGSGEVTLHAQLSDGSEVELDLDAAVARALALDILAAAVLVARDDWAPRKLDA